MWKKSYRIFVLILGTSKWSQSSPIIRNIRRTQKSTRNLSRTWFNSYGIHHCGECLLPWRNSTILFTRILWYSSGKSRTVLPSGLAHLFEYISTCCAIILNLFVLLFQINSILRETSLRNSESQTPANIVLDRTTSPPGSQDLQAFVE